MHDDEDDHSHFDFSDDSEMEDIEGIEKFTLHSVGIDIGSSTTHTIFSRLILRREGAGLSAKFVVTNRDVLYRSPIMLTPYITGTEIDTDTVKSFIEKSYEGLHRICIDHFETELDKRGLTSGMEPQAYIDLDYEWDYSKAEA